MHKRIQKNGYEIVIRVGEFPFVEDDDQNVDVDVVFESGKIGKATFVTIKNIQSLIDRYKETGECESGLFFFCNDMIIVETLNVNVIERSVEALLKSGEFPAAFFVSGPEPKQQSDRAVLLRRRGPQGQEGHRS